MNINIDNLSPEAKELIALSQKGKEIGHERNENFDLQSALQKSPDLLKGVNGFMGWIAQIERAAERKDAADSIPHETSRVARDVVKTLPKQTEDPDKEREQKQDR